MTLTTMYSTPKKYGTLLIKLSIRISKFTRSLMKDGHGNIIIDEKNIANEFNNQLIETGNNLQNVTRHHL